DLFSSCKPLMEKRAVVQSMRKRDDLDIFNLFRDPFRNIMGYREYLWEEVSLFGRFGLDRLFNCTEEYGKRLEEGHFHARQALDDMISHYNNHHIPCHREGGAGACPCLSDTSSAHTCPGEGLHRDNIKHRQNMNNIENRQNINPEPLQESAGLLLDKFIFSLRHDGLVMTGKRLFRRIFR
ncbi:MAG: hypothetical protein HQK66_14860, partial [Desulfamplus sp.]|nr:hypothetical protein [Desulfamplus sp.]